MSDDRSGARRGGPRFSQELRELVAHFGDRSVSVAEVLDVTRGRGFSLLLVCVSLPFISPIPLPGFSIPFGIVVAILGARIALGMAPWLPAALLRRELPPHLIARVLGAAGAVVRFLEVFMRPRHEWLHQMPALRRARGVMIALCGVCLLIPLPLPFSNSLPASTVLLFSAGDIERDGVFLLLGGVAFLLTLAYFSAIAIGGMHALDALLPHLPLAALPAVDAP